MTGAAVLAFALIATTADAADAATGKEVSYKAGQVTAKGYLALPEGAGKHPGVLVVHEWWGHNAYARKRADMLAEMGYAALAVDMYGDGKTAAHPQDAGAFAGEVRKNMDEARARFEAAMKFLQELPEVDADRIAAIGYCFGGNVVLQMARFGVEGLDGVASFHGALNLQHPDDGKTVDAKVLVCHGAADGFIPEDVVEEFKKEMNAAEADLTFIAYPGAKHSFTNPDADKLAEEFGMDIAYDKSADEKSWAELKAFLKEVFGE